MTGFDYKKRILLQFRAPFFIDGSIKSDLKVKISCIIMLKLLVKKGNKPKLT